MKEYFCIPYWRHCQTPICLIENPPKQWFDNNKSGLIRFCLMTDGRFIFGDGYEIVHSDIVRAPYNTGKKSAPYMVGVLKRTQPQDKWTMLNIQMYWGASLSYEEQFHNAKDLLSRLLTWKEITDMIGFVEFIDPQTYGFKNE